MQLILLFGPLSILSPILPSSFPCSPLCSSIKAPYQSIIYPYSFCPCLTAQFFSLFAPVHPVPGACPPTSAPAVPLLNTARASSYCYFIYCYIFVYCISYNYYVWY